MAAVITEDEKRQEQEQERSPLAVERNYFAEERSIGSAHLKRNPNHFVKFLLLGIFGVVLVAAGFFWWQYASSFEGTDDAYITGHVHQLGARVAGTVTKVTVDDNQHVQEGQLLVQIDPTDLQLSAESAKAAEEKATWQAAEARSNTIVNARQAASQAFQASSAVASAKAQINKARETLEDAKLGVIMTKTQVQQRQAELTLAQADFKRYENLVKDRAVTTQSFDRARQDKEVAEANLEGAQASYTQMLVKVKESQQALKDTESNAVRALGTEESASAARAQTEASKKTVAVQEAAAKQAQAEYENALTQLSYTRIVAPVNGTIGHKTVEVGQQIERGQALMSVVSDEKWVVANFKETQVGRMRVGQVVDIKIDALPNNHFKGRVDSMSPASGAQFSMLPPDNATGNFTKVVQRIPVKIVFDPESIKGYEALLTPGMSVIPEVHVGH
jgi:membrane fusion protein (multidrug efflux system)